MNKKDLNNLLKNLDSFKKQAIRIGEEGGDFKIFIKFYTANKIGIKFNKDGHNIEVVAAYMAARIGANVICSAKADRLGADLIINGLPIQIKYNWVEGLFDWEYEDRYIWIYDDKEYITVVYPQEKDNAIKALSRFILSDASKLRLSEQTIKDVTSIWDWFVKT
mgnify:CR=1 FL=1